jgi:hypothetical protein
MVDEPHDAVKLLLARMDSHPEEFRLKDPSYHDRWYNHMSAINTYGNEADKAALAAKIRDIRMGVIHEQVMEELCNGPENRRREEEEQEYERNLAASVQHMKQQQARQHLTAQQQAYDVDRDMYRSAGVTHIAGQGPSLKAGITTQPTLSSSAINQIKQALGIKK